MKHSILILAIFLLSNCSLQNNEYENIALKESTDFILEDCRRDIRCFQAEYLMNPEKIGPFFQPIKSTFESLLESCNKIEKETQSENFIREYKQAIIRINRTIKSEINDSSIPFLTAKDSIIESENKNILVNHIVRQFSDVLIHVYSYVDASFCGIEYLSFNQNKTCDELSTKFTLKSRYIQSFNGLSKKIEIDSILTPSKTKIEKYETKIDSSFGNIIVPNKNQEKLKIYGKVKLVGSNGAEREYPIEIN
ncbi:MAG: hypothetical protein ACPF8V_01860 [Luteibaculum sp.]